MRSKFGLVGSLLVIILGLGAFLSVWADTIHLKDGSTVKGKVTGFREQQFIILVGDGSRGRRSEMRIYPEDIESIEFDADSTAVPTTAVNGDSATPRPVSTSAATTNPPTTSTQPTNNGNTGGANGDDRSPIIVGRNNGGISSNGNPTNGNSSANTSSTSRPTNSSNGTGNTGGSLSQVINSRPPLSSNSSTSNNSPSTGTNNAGNTGETETGISENPPVSTNSAPVTTTKVSRGKPITLKIKVLADNTANGWTNAGIVVKKGQRLRITANGRVSLGNGRFATPAGVGSLPDKDKLMQTEPTGSLIAVIGDNNNDFVFIGSSREFIVQRDGILFLGVNEGYLNDNSGAFETTLEIEDVK